MQMMNRKKNVEFRLIDDEELPPVIIKQNEDDNTVPVIVLNQHYKIWLGLQRSTIPGIAQSLAEKLNQICDSYLVEQMTYAEMDWED